MLVSTKGRYSLRVMVDLAEHGNGEYVPLKEVAERQSISLKYLEKILPVLTKNGFIETVHGKGGGYRLTRAPERYTVGEILRTVEEDGIATVACLKCGSKPCERAAECRTLPLWQRLDGMITSFLDGVTLADLIKPDLPGNYVI